MEDRPYQAAAEKAVETELEKGTYQQLLAMATGTGKTVVFCNLREKLLSKLPGQMLVLAHREELIDQAIEKMHTIAPHLKIDKEKAKHKADPSTADVIVASVASISRNERLAKYNWEHVDKLVTDEAHHSTAVSYLRIYDAGGYLKDESKRLLLGVTATPSRSDGTPLAKVYKKIVFTYSMRQAIDEGWLVDVLGMPVFSNTSLDQVKTNKGDFDQRQLARAVNTPSRNQFTVKAWLDYGKGRQTIGFTVDIGHAVDLADMFKHYGVKAEAVWGDDPDRKEKLLRHRNGETTVLLNCGVLTEGYDDWRVSCILLARPTKSSVLFTQMVGRGTRLENGTGNLKQALDLYNCNGDNIDFKQDCIVIDVVDSSSRHSLITLPTLLGLGANLNLKGTSVVKALKTIEEMQKKYPYIDFSQLLDITEIETFVQSVNLFEAKFPPEVEEHSELTWHRAADGGLILLLPGREDIRIKQNLLDKWEIYGTIHSQKYRGTRESIEDAFKAADDLITEKAADHLKVLRRVETWHKDPATEGQLALLKKFYKGKAIPNNLTKGKASMLISSFLAGKAK